MDLKSGLPITRRKVTNIPVKTLVTKSVDNMAAENRIATLKFENKSGVLFHPNYCLTGVNNVDKNANESEDTNNDEQNS